MATAIAPSPVSGSVKAPKAPKVKPTKPPVRTFTAKMSLIDARSTLLASVRGVRSGGFTQRAGSVLKAVLGLKFGTYLPSDVMDALRDKGFPARFKGEVDAWVKGWDMDGVSQATIDARNKQLKAVEAFMAQARWDVLADAIESILAQRAQQWSLTDAAGNARTASLVDCLDVMFGIRMTAARAASLRFIA